MLQTLRIVAWCALFAGIGFATYAWVMMGSREISNFTLGLRYHEINPLGVCIGFGFVAYGFGIWAILLALCTIADRIKHD